MRTEYSHWWRHRVLQMNFSHVFFRRQWLTRIVSKCFNLVLDYRKGSIRFFSVRLLSLFRVLVASCLTLIRVIYMRARVSSQSEVSDGARWLFFALALASLFIISCVFVPFWIIRRVQFMPLLPLPLSAICLLCTRPRLSGSFCYQWANRVEQHAKLWCLGANEWAEVRSLCTHPFCICISHHLTWSGFVKSLKKRQR